MTASKKLRKLLNEQGILVVPGAYDALSARIIEESGFPALMATGAGISNSFLGWADVGLMSSTEVCTVIDKIVDVTSIPVIADIDTGYGNAINVYRTTRMFEKLGVAALHIEDQVAPKKCGHFSGKNVISKAEMVNKIMAITDARVDNDLVIVARTDARAVNGLEDAIDRGLSYAEAGADVIFIEAPQTVEELKIIPKHFKGVPLMVNMVEGGLTPIMSVEDLDDMGFKIVTCPNTALRAAIKAMKHTLEVLAKERDQNKLLHLISTVDERQNLVKLPEIKAMEQKYLHF